MNTKRLNSQGDNFAFLPDEIVILIFTRLSNSDAPHDTLTDIRSLGQCLGVCKRFNSLVYRVPELSIKHPSCKILYDYCPRFLPKFEHIRSLQVKHWSRIEMLMNEKQKPLPILYFDASYQPHGYCLVVLSYKKISFYSDVGVRDMLLDDTTDDTTDDTADDTIDHGDHAYDLFLLHHMLVSSIKNHRDLQSVVVSDFLNRGMFSLENNMLGELRDCSGTNLKLVKGCDRTGFVDNLDFPLSDLHGVILNKVSFHIMEWSDDPKHEVEVKFNGDGDGDGAGARAIPTGLPFRGSQGVLVKNYLQSLLNSAAYISVDNDLRISGILSRLFRDGNLL